MTRLTSRVTKLLDRAASNCAAIQTKAMPERIQRLGMRLARKPTSTPEMEYRKKNALLIKPNCSGVSFSSSIICGPAKAKMVLSSTLIITTVISKATTNGRLLSGSECMGMAFN